jgi:UDP-N-acetylglucosamine 4,6-dehydratase
MFKDKVLLITGGTGSFGNAVLKRYLTSQIKEIRIFSRDEKKQFDMRQKYNNDNIKFYIGDVRDFKSIYSALKGVDFVFHAAALKQVPSCEFYPMEAIKTNTLGAENVMEAAIQQKVKRVVLLSTDKAVYPINAMGMTKALMERVMIAKSINVEDTVLCCTRYGNVMATRGSVIPLFINKIRNNEPLTITNPDMTRFMMHLNESVDLVIYAFSHGQQGDIFVRKSPGCTIMDIARALIELFGKGSIKIIGTRHGEKEHETLVNKEEMSRAEDIDFYYRISADTRDLNYNKYFVEGNKELKTEYTSYNTNRLSLEETKKLLLTLDCVQDYVKNNDNCRYSAGDY